jgi:hypothetical protein
MSSPESTVDHYLGEFRAGCWAEAFHGLIESGPAVISDLITAYEGATDLDCEVFVIEVISEFRLDSSLGFLRHALRRDDPRIWKAALNGMVMVESRQAVDAMDHVFSSIQDSEKKEWIEEAITDTYTAMMEKAEHVGVEAGDEFPRLVRSMSSESPYPCD